MIAHARQDRNGEWILHSLEEHCQSVARLAADFARPFGGEDWAYLAGLLHDLGKFSPSWQAYIRKETGYDPEAHIEGGHGRINHSDAGMRWGFIQWGRQFPPAKILAYLVGGHHAGLPDWSPDEAGGDLVNRIPLTIDGRGIPRDDFDRIIGEPFVAGLLELPPPTSSPLRADKNPNPQALLQHFHLWVRMLYSCLVDADFLNTEEFMEPERGEARGGFVTLEELKIRFDTHMRILADEADATPVNAVRQQVLQACRDKACLEPGFFSLNVPTGGGKTLASMAFALEHAIRHGKSRIVMAIPYTSIIEQTAKVYRDVFGEENVIEHHSNLDPERETAASRLATENWDAPIIVTTNVQLFESLFASRSSACRKLHNLIDAVIILDEAQMLPPEYLKPILSSLSGLVDCFGVSVVLCTATQPALEGRIGSQLAAFEGIPPDRIRPIIDDPEDLAKRLQRVSLDLSRTMDPLPDWQRLATELATFDQVLCIVNTRRDCRELHELMPEGTIHLSALMCPEERSLIIAEIKKKLTNDEPIRVISTQLVEAGVDIDFPVVYRALAGLDSIAQAAGRCNREGRLNDNGQLGKVVVFAPPEPAPPGLLRKGADASKAVLREGNEMTLSPTVFRHYFETFYSALNCFDVVRFKERMLDNAVRGEFQFRTLARRFRLIDDRDQVTLIVRLQGGELDNSWLVEEFQRTGPNRFLMRKLGRFTVSVHRGFVERLHEAGMLEEIHGLNFTNVRAYEPGKGLNLDAGFGIEELII